MLVQQHGKHRRKKKRQRLIAKHKVDSLSLKERHKNTTNSQLIDMLCSRSCSRSFSDSFSGKFKNNETEGKKDEKICHWTQAYRTEQRGNHTKGKTRELEQSKCNKRQQNIVGTQWSWAQHTRTGCNCVVRHWPQHIPAGIAGWMGLAMSTSLLLLTCSFLSLSSLSPPLALLLSVPLLPSFPPKPHSIQPLPSHKINLHPVHLVLVLCSDTTTYYSA